MKVRFKLKTEKDKKFYWCYIFSTREEMYDWNRKDGYDGGKHYLGVCRHTTRYLVSKNGRTKRIKKDELGSISLVVNYCTSGIIAHECCHATNYWFKYKYKDFTKLEKSKHDEIFAWVLGNFNRQVWYNWYKLEEKGIIKKLKA
jgi:hypothetical protein